jgi:DNA-binding CsgD family transcriptional regulator
MRLHLRVFHVQWKQIRAFFVALATGIPENRNGAVEKPSLTEREIECLKWSAEGKTYEDIGMLLGISARTVRFFLENARHKLGSLNTTHAVANAMLRGLI